MTRILVSALALAALAPIGAAAQPPSSPILPGYWESTNTSQFLWQRKVSQSRKCISAEQVRTYMTGFSNRHYVCTYEHAMFANGRAHMTGYCVDKHGLKAGVTVNGAYDPSHFYLRARVNLAGFPLIGATTDAHRIADTCPAGTEGK